LIRPSLIRTQEEGGHLGGGRRGDYHCVHLKLGEQTFTPVLATVKIAH
jgi:hypothetical protein